MAGEVDAVTKILLDRKAPQGLDHDVFVCFLERFAALVIANHPPQSSMAWQEGNEAGRLAEREACAKVCESLAGQQWVTREAALECSDAIRARGNT